MKLPVRSVLRDGRRFERLAPVVDGGVVVGFEPPGADAPPWFAIPGLRNAHVHLDLTEAVRVPRATRGFGAWVLDLLRARGPFDPAALQRAAARGARLSLASGTTAVVDIDSSGAAASAVAASGLRGIACREILGRRDPEELALDVASWIERFASFAPSGRLRPGVSPHAPYSTPAALYRVASALAERTGCGYSTHLAETRAESEFIAAGTGEFAALLSHLKVELPFSVPPGGTPVEYVASVSPWPSGALLAHVNYPSAGDDEILRSRDAIAVYCPRSHAFFGHSRHPIAEYLERGVRVALGTDSLASNGSLSMLDELAYLRVARPDLDRALLFDLATSAAAREIDGGSGTLDPGESADLVLVAARGGVPDDLDQALDAVTSGTLEIVATMVAGEVCFAREDDAGEILVGAGRDCR